MLRESEDLSVYVVCMNVMNSLTRWVRGAAFMATIIFAVLFPGSSHFLQHVYLCTTGYVILMAEAILTFSPSNDWSKGLTHSDKKVIHWVMQVIGATLAITGSIIRMVNLSNNFTSPHGILGLVAMILTGLNLIGGVIGLYTKPTLISKIMHSCLGSLTLIAAFVTLCLGITKPVFRGILGDTIADLTIAFTVIGLVGTLCSASVSGFNRVTKR